MIWVVLCRTVAHQCAAKGRHRSTWKFLRSLNLMAASMYTKSIHRDTVGRQTPLSEKAKQHKDVRAWLIYKAVNIKQKCLRRQLFVFIWLLKFRKCWSRGSWFNTTSVGREDQQPKTPCWTLKRDSLSLSPHSLLIQHWYQNRTRYLRIPEGISIGSTNSSDSSTQTLRRYHNLRIHLQF